MYTAINDDCECKLWYSLPLLMAVNENYGVHLCKWWLWIKALVFTAINDVHWMQTVVSTAINDGCKCKCYCPRPTMMVVNVDCVVHYHWWWPWFQLPLRIAVNAIIDGTCQRWWLWCKLCCPLSLIMAVTANFGVHSH